MALAGDRSKVLMPTADIATGTATETGSSIGATI